MTVFHIHDFDWSNISEMIPDSVITDHSTQYLLGFRHGLAFSLFLDLQRIRDTHAVSTVASEAFDLGWLDGRSHAIRSNLDFRAAWRRLVDAARVLGVSGASHHLQFVGGTPPLRNALTNLWRAELP